MMLTFLEMFERDTARADNGPIAVEGRNEHAHDRDEP